MIKRISVLGSGWLGLPLCLKLSESGYPLKVSTRSHDKVLQLQQMGLSAHLYDIENLAQSEPDFLECDILIINITSKNIPAYQQLIEEIKKVRIEHVLFISSTSVYQNTQALVMEDAGLENPDSLVFQIEELFRHCSAFTPTLIRMSGLIGPKRHPGRFFRNGKIVRQPDAPVNLIHLDDCLGLIQSVLKQDFWGETINGCADSHPTKRVFYSHMAKLLNTPLPTFASPPSDNYKIVSNEKAKSQLNYQYHHPDLMEIDFQ